MVLLTSCNPSSEPQTTSSLAGWHYQLDGSVLVKQVRLVDLDLEAATPAVVNAYHSQGSSVVCYLSAGTWEDYREDAGKFPEEVLGDPLDDWPGERWLDISSYESFAALMTAKMDLAATAGCDAIEVDNVDGYANPTGFSLTYEEQLAYNRWLASEAHIRNLEIGLKNDLAQVTDLVDDFDFLIVEECVAYQECDQVSPFIRAGKPVFGVEYEGDLLALCAEGTQQGISMILADPELSGDTTSC